MSYVLCPCGSYARCVDPYGCGLPDPETELERQREENEIRSVAAEARDSAEGKQAE